MYREDTNLSLDYFSRREKKGGGVLQSASQLISRLTSMPRNVLHQLDDMNTRLIEEQLRMQAQRVRQPRFTSFTMQLEPYNKKKADALKTLNDINMNVVQSESIQKLFEMDKYVFIFTAKRVICVEENTTGKAAGRLRH